MEERFIDPDEGVYATTPDYVHGVELVGVNRLLLVSGTMGLAEDGRAPGSLDAQLDLVWTNIERILRAADMSMANIVRVTSYLRDASYAPRNQAARIAALGARRVPTTALVVGTLQEDWKVEIEVMAAA